MNNSLNLNQNRRQSSDVIVNNTNYLSTIETNVMEEEDNRNNINYGSTNECSNPLKIKSNEITNYSASHSNHNLIDTSNHNLIDISNERVTDSPVFVMNSSNGMHSVVGHGMGNNRYKPSDDVMSED